MMNKFRTNILAISFAFLVLLAMPLHANAQSENRVVKIVNESSAPIYHLYVSNVGEDNWGLDQLGIYQTIDSDRYRVFNMDDGTGYCMFDLKAVLSDGREAIRRNFNVCRESSWTITN